jgi:hypothetical protein
MAGFINAEDAVRRTRRYCAIMDSGTYRDGFSTDASLATSLIPILFFENLAIRLLCDTGIVQEDHLITAVSGEKQYAYPSGMGKVVELSYVVSGEYGLRAKPLRETTLSELRARDRYYSYTGGEPCVYVSVGPKFYLYPVPDGHTDNPGPIGITGHKLIGDLVNPSDTPGELPMWYHEAYPLLGAILLLATDDNPSRQGRIEPLSNLFKELYPDLEELVTSRSVIKWQSRAEGDTLQRRMTDGNGA